MSLQKLRTALDGVLSLVYPDFCKICGAFVAQSRNASICEDCWDGIRRIENPICHGCGLPLPAGYQQMASPPRCGECLFEAYPFDIGRAAAYYEGPLREAIHLFKFGRRRNLAHRLSDLLFHVYQEHRIHMPADAIVAVPLHASRLRERGFNQSELMAKELARRIRLPYDPTVLTRWRATPPQSGQNKKARARNIHRAFQTRYPKRIENNAFLLVDDVFTTGATLTECARSLRAAGARAVYALTLARVV
ncbi:MAG: ComF family protein [Acidobacteria bacterium]|nr:ComF family protein [Acidobacteriota bacterium]MBI3655680.1 ComF family protein [Acidobacteriota bacterium]